MSKSVAIQMEEVLEEVSLEVKDAANKGMKSTAKEAVQQLKNTSPKQENSKRAGKYARGWRKKESDMEVVVYNATDWQLTHLLENGHAVSNRFGETGARAAAVKHIEPVEKWASSELPIRISRGIK